MALLMPSEFPRGRRMVLLRNLTQSSVVTSRKNIGKTENNDGVFAVQIEFLITLRTVLLWCY